ncbi:MAG: hypothetical protein FK733_02585 [Asgard group archaeon]|nr:hypothetical protein [Asgard group archaeon]
MSRRGASNGRGRHRRMLELTGVPGWIRFGTTPGFGGPGRGLGPCADYIQKTGQMSEFMVDLAARNPNIKIWQDTMSKIENENPTYKRDLISQRIHELEIELKELKKQYKELK